MTNRYEIHGDTVAIYLGKTGTVKTLISLEDLARVREPAGTWGLQTTQRGFSYAMMSQFDRSGQRPRRTLGVLLHRFILDVKPGLHVDHINHDTLDNRRENLRPASRSLNALNRARASVHQVGDQWHTRVASLGRSYHLGFYPTRHEAELVYTGAKQILEMQLLEKQA